jgi:hypothetical protein
MAGESSRHVRLVEELINEVQTRHANGKQLIMLAEHVRFGPDRPPKLGGFVPDLFAHDIPITSRIIGEAKTELDMETDRSQLQLAAFLDHLSLYANSSMYVAVPWAFAPRARTILRGLSHERYASVSLRVLPIMIR